MTSGDRRPVAKTVAANIAVAGVLSVGAAVSAGATAAADDGAPPTDPVAAPPAGLSTDPVAAPPAGLSDILGGAVTNILGQPAQTGPGAPVDFLLSQYAVPAVPGAPPPGMDINNALSGSSYLLPQNFKLSAPDDGNMYTIGQGDVRDQPSLVPALKGAHALWHGGMGKLTLDQLGQPLPGTAPPPGTNLPPGPLQFYEPPPPIPLPGIPPPPPPGG
jgi:hypothetical protein